MKPSGPGDRVPVKPHRKAPGKTPHVKSAKAPDTARLRGDRSGKETARATVQAPEKGWRLARRIALAGHYSRRGADARISAGAVRVDGVIETNLARTVTSEARIEVDGKRLPPIEAVRIWRYHKPRGVIATRSDPQGRQTAPQALQRFFPKGITPFLVGRLDYTSEGLLLLTNHGALARHLELPASGFRRIYRVRAFGLLSEAGHQRIEGGALIDGLRYRPARLTEDEAPALRADAVPAPAADGSTGPAAARHKNSQTTTTNNKWYRIEITEGKNREVRRLFEAEGLQVSRLIRVGFGPFDLGDLPTGEVLEIPVRDAAPLARAAGLEKSAGRAAPEPAKTRGRRRPDSAQPRGQGRDQGKNGTKDRPANRAGSKGDREGGDKASSRADAPGKAPAGGNNGKARITKRSDKKPNRKGPGAAGHRGGVT